MSPTRGVLKFVIAAFVVLAVYWGFLRGWSGSPEELSAVDSLLSVLSTNVVEQPVRTAGDPETAEIPAVSDLSERDSLPDSGGWSESPQVMESLLLNQLPALGIQMISLESVSCSLVECVVRYMAADPPLQEDRYSYFKAVTGPPINATGYRGGAKRNRDGVYEVTFTVTNGYAPDTPDVTLDPSRFPFTEESLTMIAEGADFSGTQDDAAVEIGEWNGVPIVVEQFCLEACPRDRIKVVHLLVPGPDICGALGQDLRTFVTRTRTSQILERQLCVPVPLDDD